MSTSSISAKIPADLRERIDEIARLEHRSASNVVRLAIEHYVEQYTALHPQFKTDILEGLREMQAGNAEPYEFG
jgi:predicted transcriptional regulator